MNYNENMSYTIADLVLVWFAFTVSEKAHVDRGRITGRILLGSFYKSVNGGGGGTTAEPGTGHGVRFTRRRHFPADWPGGGGDAR